MIKFLIEIIKYWISISLLIAFGVLFYVQYARAEDGNYLTVSTISYHFDRKREWQEINPGFGFIHGLSENTSLAGGMYLNSYGRITAYVGGDYTVIRSEYAEAGLFLGIGTGYSKAIIAFPRITIYPRKEFGIDVIGAPKAGENSSAFIGMNLRFALK